jgi:hypothetical protein
MCECGKVRGLGKKEDEKKSHSYWLFVIGLKGILSIL